MGEVTIQGECERRFVGVRDAFAANFAAGREVGASFAAFVAGRLVVDLWAGWADAARTRPWERDTIVNLFSTTKVVTTLCAHMLVDRGTLAIAAPVAAYWPEFAAGGKAAVTVRHVLTHQAGLAALRSPLSTEALFDWDRMTGALAAEVPWWEPGSTSGYHAITYGYLVGELVRRVTGRTLGTFVREEIAGPLGADLHVGLGADADDRVAEMIPAPPTEPGPAVDPDSMLGKLMSNPKVVPEIANRRAWRRAEIPAANGHGNARSVARVMAALATSGARTGVRLLAPDVRDRTIAPQWSGRDLVLAIPMRWALGFMVGSPVLDLGPSPRAFGHGGWGGSLAVADPDADVAWAYVMNRMLPGTTGDSRATGMRRALYAAL